MQIFNRQIRFAVAALVVCMAATCAAQISEPEQHGAIMEQKLQSAQEIFAAVATEDFEKMERQAQKLRLLSLEAGWNILQTPEYLRLSDDFRADALQLQTASEGKNLDAAGLAFVKLSITCIDCHRHAKEELARVGRRQPAAKPKVVSSPAIGK